MARELYPDSRFVRRVERLEESEGLRFEDEVLRQFSGPSFTVLRPDGRRDADFGARSTLRDRAAMRPLLAKIAPALPGVLEGLQGLGSFGMTGLLFVAPDAPLTPAAFGLLAAVTVSRLAGGASEELYEVQGLDSSGLRPGPDSVVYGRSATRLEVDVAALVERSAAELGEQASSTVRALVERAEATASAEDGDIAAEVEVTWAR